MSYKRINSNEANLLIDNNSTIVVDIRDTDSFADSHIEGAINLTQSNLSKFIQDTNKETDIIVVCYHGNSSQTAAAYLSQHGFKNVYSLDGGYVAWENSTRD